MIEKTTTFRVITSAAVLTIAIREGEYNSPSLEIDEQATGRRTWVNFSGDEMRELAKLFLRASNEAKRGRA